MRKPVITMKDIAQRAGVSTVTVSAVLSGKSSGVFASENTRQRILGIAEELGYRPNRIARALATGRTHVIALWLFGLAPPFFARMIGFVSEELRHTEYEMIIRSMQFFEGRPTDDWLDSRWPVDGILACDGPEYVDWLLAAQKTPPPIVNFGVYVSPKVDSVQIDYYSGAEEAVRHLVAPGCRRVAYVVNEWGNHPGDARYDAYMRVMADAGLAPEVIETPIDTTAVVRQRIRDYVQSRGCPEAMFCFSDTMALGAYRGLLDLGVRMPDDVALVGCDGIEWTEFVDHPISTIVPPAQQCCSLAWQYLRQRMQIPDGPLQQTILPSHLVVRESSRR